MTVLVCVDHDNSGDVDIEELEALDLLLYSPVNVDGAVLGPPFPVVHDQIICLAHIEGDVVVQAPDYQFYDHLPIGCLIVVGDQANHYCVVRKLNDGVGVVFANPYHLGAARQEVQDPVLEGGV